MSFSPWPLGTDSGGKLRAGLRTFLKTWLFDVKYKPRLPHKKHLTLLDEGKTEGAGITIRIISENDAESPWPFNAGGGRRAVTDSHQVALVVKADRTAGGAESVSAVFGVLRTLFATRYGMPERDALESAGIQNCMETPEGLVVDEGTHPENEGTFFSQQLNLRCNTDTYLD